MNVNDFQNIEHYELERLTINKKIVQEQSRYEYDLQDGLDAAISCQSSLEVVE